MDTKENIQRLLDLFMEGKTSLEEELELSRYFSTNDVPQEWEAYKEMFSYFDEGMPEGRYKGLRKPSFISGRVFWTAIAAAAAAVLLFVMTWKHGDTTAIKPGQQPQIAAVATDTLYNNKADTASTDAQTNPAKHKKSKTGKYKYRIAPPKTYYAKAQTAPANMNSDSLSRDELLISAQLESAEIADKLLLRKLELMEQAHELEVTLASNEETFDDEEAETVY